MNPVQTTYLQNYNTLLRYAHRLTRSREAAEDLLQLLYIKLVETKTDPSIIEEPLAYCRKSVFGLYFNEIRTTTRRNVRDYVNQEELLAQRQDWIDDLAILPLRLDLIAEFSNLLLARQKAVFIAMLQGKDIRTIAQEQGRTYNTTKHNRRLILQKLKHFFEEKGEELHGIEISS